MRRLIVLVTSMATVAGTALVTLMVAAPAAYAAAGDAAKKVIASNFPDPGFGRFTTQAQGTRYYLYATGGGFRVASSSTGPTSGYTVHGNSMTEVPAWTRDTNRQAWAPHVVQTHTTAGSELFTMYFAARDKQDRHCLGAATSQSPTGPFHPLDSPLLCPPSGFDETIDPVGYQNAAGERWVVYKLGDNSGTRRFRIMAIQVGATRGLYPVEGASPRLVLDFGASVGEAPDVYRGSDSRVHLFVSRNGYKDCNYATQVWSGDNLWTLGNGRWVAGMSTSTTDRFCGPGGAEIIDSPSGRYMAFHTRYSADPLVRHAWVGQITRDSDGTWRLL